MFFSHARSRNQSRREKRQGGLPRATASRCTSPRHEGGRRRAIGVVAALSRHPRATAPMVRRWSASETEADQKAGAEGTGIAHIPHIPARPTNSRTRDPSRSETEGGVNPTLRRRRRTRRPGFQDTDGELSTTSVRHPPIHPSPTLKYDDFVTSLVLCDSTLR